MSKYTLIFEVAIFSLDQEKILDSLLKNLGAEKTLTSSKGDKFSLPRGVYSLTSDMTREEIYKKVFDFMSENEVLCPMLITESKGRTWLKLKMAS